MRRPFLATAIAILLVAQGISLASTATAAPPGPGQGPAQGPTPTADPTRPILSAMSGGNTVGGDVREDRPRKDGYRHIDTSTLIKRLTAAHATTYTFGIWDSPTDWDDLRLEFAPAAQRAGIEVMVYLVPPSECFLNQARHLAGRCSRPYELDYRAWAEQIAGLSVRYPNVTGWAIDDFLVSGPNADLFTKDYLAGLRAITDAVNPELKFYVTLYGWQINDDDLSLISDSLDGVIYPYLGYNNNTVDDTWVQPRLDEYGSKTDQYGLDLILLVYTGRFLDGIQPPTGDYVGKVLDRATPYLDDGRIAGIIAYGAPLQIDKQKPSAEYLARSGTGRLSLSVSNFQSTPDGAWAQAAQRVAVDPRASRISLTFQHFDQEKPGTALGYHTKQLLVDGAVAWQSDVVADAGGSWIPTTVDLTSRLAGKTEATIAFRLTDRTGVGWWPIDVGIDDVTATGLRLRNAGFDDRSGWALSRSDDGIQPYIDLYHADEPVRVVNAIGAGYAAILGEHFTPLRTPRWPGLRTGPGNRAMYGNGRLSLSAPADTPIPAGSCATATQRVSIDARSPRQEISFWHTDRVQASGLDGRMFKELSIDGRQVWKRDVIDFWWWDYINGSDHQGPIDITDFVAGKRSVQLTFGLCVDQDTPDLGIDVGFDHLSTIGFRLQNPEFEQPGGWTLHSGGPLSAKIDRVGPPVPVSAPGR